MKLSTIKYRREKVTQSPYKKHDKGKKAYRYPPWITDPRNPEHPMPKELLNELRANLLRVFPKLAQMPVEKRPPRSIWLYAPRTT